jgi:hypothetical protein
MPRFWAHTPGYAVPPRKDPEYLVVHGMRTAMWAVARARRLPGASKSLVDAVFLSGLVHDIGKAHPEAWSKGAPDAPVGSFAPATCGPFHQDYGAALLFKHGHLLGCVAVDGHHGYGPTSLAEVVSKYRGNAAMFADADAIIEALREEDAPCAEREDLAMTRNPSSLPPEYLFSSDSTTEYLARIKDFLKRPPLRVAGAPGQPGAWTVPFMEDRIASHVDLRMIYGCFTWADSLVTANFRHPDIPLREPWDDVRPPPWERLLEDVMERAVRRMSMSRTCADCGRRLDPGEARCGCGSASPPVVRRSRKTVVRLRNRLQRIARKNARRLAKGFGLGMLIAPTGLGKTAAMLLAALTLAIERKATRIVIAEPYIAVCNEILDHIKNYQHLARIDGGMYKMFNPGGHDDYLLNQYGDSGFRDYEKQRAAADDWEKPIVLTTIARLMPAFFSRGRSDAARFPALAGAVLIVDEPQAILYNSDVGVKPNERSNQIEVVSALCHDLLRYGTMSIFSSATPPNMHCARRSTSDFRAPAGKMEDLASKSLQDAMAKALRHRVKIIDRMEWGTQRTAERMSRRKQAVVMMHTRRLAKKMLAALEDIRATMPLDEKPELLFVSGDKLPRHNKQTLKLAKELLLAGKAVWLVSTGMIKCGIDIDFPYGFCQAGALSDMLQFMGRVNREGKRSYSSCYLVCKHERGHSPTQESAKFDAGLEIARLSRLRRLDRLKQPDTIGGLWERTYLRDAARGTGNSFLRYLIEMDFDSVSRLGRAIAENDVSVIVKVEDSPPEINKLIDHLEKSASNIPWELNKIMYDNSVGVFRPGPGEGLIGRCLEAGVVREAAMHPGVYIAEEGCYCEEQGLKIPY